VSCRAGRGRGLAVRRVGVVEGARGMGQGLPACAARQSSAPLLHGPTSIEMPQPLCDRHCGVLVTHTKYPRCQKFEYSFAVALLSSGPGC
jgi:hypothetical protein